MEIVAALIAGLVAFISSIFGGGWDISYTSPFRGEEKSATIIFGGDMMFDRGIRVVGEKEGGDFLLSCIAKTLREVDLVVANLEGPITGSKSKSVGSVPGGANNTVFTFPTSTATLLVRHNIRVVSLGNNHIHNFGDPGVRTTKQYLDEAGVGHFGDPLAEEVWRGEIEGVKVAFVGYNGFQTLGGEEWFGSTSTISHIKATREGGYLPIVLAHWGEEYVAANAEQKKLAREFIDAGAEMVIGSHPHVVQEHELYGTSTSLSASKHIYYSLGNFIFDQYFDEDVRNGLLVSVILTQDGVKSAEEIPIRLERDRRTCPVR